MPNYRAVSEPWLERMVDELGENVVLVAAPCVGGATTFGKGLPLFEMARLQRARRFFSRRGLASIGYRLPELAKEAQRLQVNVVLCHFANFAIEIAPLWKALDVPVYVHNHGMDVHPFMRESVPPFAPVHPPDYAQSLTALGQRVEFIANSQYTATVLQSHGIPKEKIHVKTLGVRAAESAKVHVRKSQVQVIAIGRLVDCKAPHKTIAAFCKACELGMDADLHLVGDGPLQAKCEAARAASPYAERIKLHGALPFEKLQTLFADADIFTQHNETGENSRQVEAFGVTFLEAMALGIPTVGTRSGGPCEIVVEGETGLMGDAGDIEAQAKGLRDLAQYPEMRTTMGRAGWERVKSDFSLEREGQRLLEILDGKP